MEILSDKRIVARGPLTRSVGKTYSEVIYGYFEEDVKQAIKELKEEFHKCWNTDFKDSVLNELTSHYEMCYGDLERLNLKSNCNCIKIIDEFLFKIFGDKLI